jgi:hypothetical protein
MQVTDKQKKEVYKIAFGEEYDDLSRKQIPLPLDIAYEVAINKLKKKTILDEIQVGMDNFFTEIDKIIDKGV